MKRGDMKDEMLCAIALRYPFSLQEVYEAHQMLESYDVTIKACEMAGEHFMSLSTTVEEVLEEKNAGPKDCCTSMKDARINGAILWHADNQNGSVWVLNRDRTIRRISFCPFCGKKISGEL